MTDTDCLAQAIRPSAALPAPARTPFGEQPDDPNHGRPSNDLTRLLRCRGIGPQVIHRLMKVGVRSITDLQRRGVDSTVNDICNQIGELAWRNRTEALAHALAELTSPSAQGT